MASEYSASGRPWRTSPKRCSQYGMRMGASACSSMLTVTRGACAWQHDLRGVVGSQNCGQWQRGSRADGQHVPSTASSLMLAQSACCHTAAGARTCGLPPLCAQSLGLRPCPLEVRVLPAPFAERYQSRLRFGPRLMTACANCRISPQLLEHAQIPQLRCVVQIRVPLAGAPGGANIPSPVTADAPAPGRLAA